MRKKEGGFTLIELLVVIAIIGILAGVIISSLNTARAKARDAQRLNDIRQIQTALALYYDQNNSYPASGGAEIPNSAWSASNAPSSWTTLATTLAPYIKLPSDPKNESGVWGGTGYTYSYLSLGSSCPGYILVYCLETNNSALSPGVKDCSGVTYNFKWNPTMSLGYTVGIGVVN